VANLSGKPDKILKKSPNFFPLFHKVQLKNTDFSFKLVQIKISFPEIVQTSLAFI
jgi:hypothetical protein